jgi:hypothetical protein
MRAALAPTVVSAFSALAYDAGILTKLSRFGNPVSNFDQAGKCDFGDSQSPAMLYGRIWH